MGKDKHISIKFIQMNLQLVSQSMMYVLPRVPARVLDDEMSPF